MVSNLMGGIVGGGQVEDDDIGLLDNPSPADNNVGAGGRGGAGKGRGTDTDGGRTSSNKKPQSANQDLWLLTFFFKGCALLV